MSETPAGQDGSPGDTTAPQTDQFAELEKRLEARIKSTIAGTVGSLSPKIDSLERMLQEQATNRDREQIDRMTPDQLREFAKKPAPPAAGSRPPASDYFRGLASDLLTDAGIDDLELPTFVPGKPSAEYETQYRQFRKAVVDKVRDKYDSESKRTVAVEVNRILKEKGLDVTDAGSGSPPGSRRVTRADLASMSVADYMKVRDNI